MDGTERKGKQYEEKPHLDARERAMAEWTKQKKTKKRTAVKEASRQGQQLEPRPGELEGGGTGREEAQVERKLSQWAGEEKTVSCIEAEQGGAVTEAAARADAAESSHRAVLERKGA